MFRDLLNPLCLALRFTAWRCQPLRVRVRPRDSTEISGSRPSVARRNTQAGRADEISVAAAAALVLPHSVFATARGRHHRPLNGEGRWKHRSIETAVKSERLRMREQAKQWARAGETQWQHITRTTFFSFSSCVPSTHIPAFEFLPGRKYMHVVQHPSSTSAATMRVRRPREPFDE
jgi:hypothetical protein